jgi:hypothetical protein
MIPIDTAGDPDVPLAVQRAVIYLAGIFLRDPAGIDKDDYRDGFIPAPLRALLNPYRTPTMR